MELLSTLKAPVGEDAVVDDDVVVTTLLITTGFKAIFTGLIEALTLFSTLPLGSKLRIGIIFEPSNRMAGLAPTFTAFNLMRCASSALRTRI
ncbi:hypothetical protein A7M48_19930 [Acinetobacter baumannii]|nr:hypothetical protein A7M48_19930 [Acinetobacter baumannii]